MKAAILSNEYIMFLALPFRYSFIPNRETGQNLLFYNYKSIS